MAETARARSTRFIAAIPALYRVIGEDEWQRGLTVNISATAPSSSRVPWLLRVGDSEKG